MIKYINDNNYFIAQLLIFCYNLSRSKFMDYSIKINEFEGPLDLLLHLIKEANIDIQDCNADKTIVLDEHSNPIQVFSPLLFSITIASLH